MAGSGQDNSQWLSVTEETLFLHDGLIRVTDLVELPHDVNNAHDSDHEVVTFDSKSPSELSERLMTVCGTQNNAYARLLEYRLNALRGFWGAQQQLAVEEQGERDSSNHDETIALLKKQGLWKESEQASFSTRVGLLLVLPLLQSQSKFDPALCSVTGELLLNCLRDCPPLSLTKEPGDCLNGLETLLCSWLGEIETGATSEHVAKDAKQRQNAASALIALTCARGHLKTFVHAVHLLQQCGDSLGPLPVADIMAHLAEVEGGQGQPTAVLGTKHVVCWGFEDMLGASDKENSATSAVVSGGSGQAEKEKDKGAEIEIGRSVACDGKFLYCTGSSGRGLAKIGTGLHGTLRGYVYARNPEMVSGRVAFGGGRLLHRPVDFDKEPETYKKVQMIETHTLKTSATVEYSEWTPNSTSVTTVGFSSDGSYFYWLWCPATLGEKSAKGSNLFLESFKIEGKKKKVPTATLR